MTFNVIGSQHKTLSVEGYYVECRYLFIVMLNVIMLSVVMLNVVAPLMQENNSLKLPQMYNEHWC